MESRELGMGYWYTPICIRLVPKGSLETFAFSGIYVVDKNKATLEHYFITISSIPYEELKSGYNLYLTSGASVTDTEILWYPVNCDNVFPIFNKLKCGEDDKLYTTLKEMLENGFRLIPIETKLTNNIKALMSINILNLKMVDKVNYNKFHSSVSSSLKPMNFNNNNSNNNKPITIESFPFSFTNPALFSNFLSQGMLNFRISDGENELAFLSDIKYLENMIGGVVQESGGNSVGLVLGNLRKLNGDGDLTCILSWNRIFKVLCQTDHDEHTLNTRGKPLHNSIVAITVEDPKTHRVYWGSGIYYNGSTIVTNDHVVNTKAKSKIVIYLDKDTKIELKFEKMNGTMVTSKYNSTVVGYDQIVTPFESLDLSYIKLSTANQQVLQSVDNISPSRRGEYSVGDKAHTVGFGLFLSPTLNLLGNDLQPIVASGVISTVSSLPFFSDSKRKYPILMITTSSCWNGSSGGGLFSNGNLIGVICSNAQVRLPEILLSNDAKAYIPSTEKISKFSLCIPIELIDLLYTHIMQEGTERRISKRVVDTWKLAQTHNDVIIEQSSKL
ncbi:hypothetical protein CAAN1_01S12662 [[Candida] anglica]|uniref:Serine protease n=1 Tax=[Candida] anglica TaxID=148631 RepID=A0ABP0EN90_9ASCO